MDFRFYVFINENDAKKQMVLLARDNFHPVMSITTVMPDIMFPNGANQGSIANANISTAANYWIVRANK
ncbi:MAG: hypothetical protein K2W81_02055 [Sphingomonas sp.]|uniref:hypothetical protein n=1 Tax=Sphingomonas sp. TaxID=28214 RepID=UPI0025DDB58F|nr:hypothetical protein [Sphingomonas sp.]MBY0282731.1 hypothetical protein [Sphingomonas sp.]